MKIGIAILCTNSYFPLGIRLVKRFNHFYIGDNKIKFFLFTDTNPDEYLPKPLDFEWIELRNKNWVEGTNAKFTSILSLESKDIDYLYFFRCRYQHFKGLRGLVFRRLSGGATLRR